MGPSDEVGNGFADGAVRHVFGHIVTHGRQVECDGVTHAQQLCKPNSRIVGRQISGLHALTKLHVARFVVAPSHEMDALALHVNDEPEVPVDEELPDELVSVGKALEIKNMIDMKVFGHCGKPDDKSQ